MTTSIHPDRPDQDSATPAATAHAATPQSQASPADTHNPRVWVGCLGCYNGGRLVGDWWEATEAPTTAADFTAAIGASTTPASHTAEAHEELWVFDHDNFSGFLTGECSPNQAAEIATTIEAVRSAGTDPTLFAAWCSHIGYDKTTENLAHFTDNYAGTWDSPRDFAASWLDEQAEQYAAMGTPVPEPFASYIDTDRYARDLFMGDMFTISLPHGDVAVFHSH